MSHHRTPTSLVGTGKSFRGHQVRAPVSVMRMGTTTARMRKVSRRTETMRRKAVWFRISCFGMEGMGWNACGLEREGWRGVSCRSGWVRRMAGCQGWDGNVITSLLKRRPEKATAMMTPAAVMMWPVFTTPLRSNVQT